MEHVTLTRRYDRVARQWTRRIAALGYPAAYKELVLQAGLQQPQWTAICDVGCGSGDFAVAVCKVHGPAATYTIIDPSAQMLTQAACALAQLGVRAKEQQTTLTRAHGRFDCVLAAHVIEHCADPATAIAELAGLTRPGGTVLLVVSRPHWCQWPIWLIWQHAWFAPHQIVNWGRTAGLTHIQTCRFSAGPPRRTSLGYIFTLNQTKKDL